MSDAKPEIFRKDGFGKKLGPLPIWAWALILAAGVYIFYRFYTNSSSSSSAGSPTLGDTTGYPAYSDSGDDTGSGQYYTGNTGTDTASSSGFTDNQSWVNAALGESSSLGVSATDLNAALSDWLNGTTISQQQADWVDKVINALGAPPTGTTGVSTVTQPAAPAAPKTGYVNGVNNPYGVSTVYAVGSASGSQYILDSAGKPVNLTSAQVSAARKAGYGYQVVVIPSLSKI